MSYLKNLEARFEEYKEAADSKLMLGLPICIIFDGANFSKFTSNLERPYDIRLANLMIECTKFMVKETGARCGFVGSDEISLILYSEGDTESIYNRRLQKLLSKLPSKLSVRFNKLLSEYIPEKAEYDVHFDCKIWNVPTLTDAADSLMLRENSVYKNAISMAAQHYFSETSLKNMNGKQKQERLFTEAGINFNDYPVSFKRGVYIQQKRIEGPFTPEEISQLPPKHNYFKNPNITISRNVITVLDLPKISSISNRIDVLIYGKEPIIYESITEPKDTEISE